MLNEGKYPVPLGSREMGVKAKMEGRRAQALLPRAFVVWVWFVLAKAVIDAKCAKL